MDEKIQQSRVMIVDDSPDATSLLTIILSRAGYEQVRSINDSQQVVEAFRDWQPDLVLLDLMMPGLDGFRVMEQLRELGPHESHVPILVITGDLSAQSRQHALEIGASDFVTKPFENTEVVLRVRNLLHARWLNEDLRASQAQLQALSQRLIETQEAERRDLARELHDEIGQTLTVVKTNLQTLRHEMDLPDTTPLVHSISVVERALSQVRDLSLNLRPAMLDDFGLAETLAWYIERQAKATNLIIDFSCGTLPCRQATVLETTCFRVVQESLTNVMRYAQASRVEVKLHCDETGLRLTIQDDGQGFDLNVASQRAARGESLGLLGLRERVALAGGQLTVHSTLGQGSQVGAYFPSASLKYPVPEGDEP